jgi:divinyl chlorophyllide a 8-vinyl-reductase
MLTTDPAEKFGSVTLRQHYERIAVEGQEYDPYTTMLAKKK